jgi:hypothetical protein
VDAIRATVASVIFIALILLGDDLFGGVKHWGDYVVAGVVYWLFMFAFWRHAHRGKLETRQAPPAA